HERRRRPPRDSAPCRLEASEQRLGEHLPTRTNHAQAPASVAMQGRQRRKVALLTARSRSKLRRWRMPMLERKQVYSWSDSADSGSLVALLHARWRLVPVRGSSSGWTAAQRSSYGPVGAERIQRTVLWARCQIWALRAAELGQSDPGRRSRAGQDRRSASRDRHDHGPLEPDADQLALGGTAAVGMAFSTRTAAMAAAVEKVELLRTRLRAEAPSRSSASCSPSCSGLVAPASRAVSVSRAARAFL